MSDTTQASAASTSSSSPSVAGGFSQATRLLKLSTPLGPDKLLAEDLVAYARQLHKEGLRTSEVAWS